MIEIAIDENDDNVFLNEIRPVYTLENNLPTMWEDIELWHKKL